jgi:hypothetical protein
MKPGHDIAVRGTNEMKNKLVPLQSTAPVTCNYADPADPDFGHGIRSITSNRCTRLAKWQTEDGPRCDEHAEARAPQEPPANSS